MTVVRGRRGAGRAVQVPQVEVDEDEEEEDGAEQPAEGPAVASDSGLQPR